MKTQQYSTPDELDTVTSQMLAEMAALKQELSEKEAMLDSMVAQWESEGYSSKALETAIEDCSGDLGITELKEEIQELSQKMMGN